MCEWGDNVQMTVKVSARKSYTGKERMKTIGIDRCLVPIVRALNDAGIYTEESCCGHGKCTGYLALMDGRLFAILKGKPEWDLFRKVVDEFDQAKSMDEKKERVHKCNGCGRVFSTAIGLGQHWRHNKHGCAYDGKEGKCPA